MGNRAPSPVLFTIDRLINDRSTTVIRPSRRGTHSLERSHSYDEIRNNHHNNKTKAMSMKCDVCGVSYSKSMQIKSHLQTSKHRLKAAIHSALQHRSDIPSSSLPFLFKSIIEFIAFSPSTSPRTNVGAHLQSVTTTNRKLTRHAQPPPTTNILMNENEWNYNDALLVHAYIRQHFDSVIPREIIKLLLRQLRCEWLWRITDAVWRSTEPDRLQGVSFECVFGNQVMTANCDIDVQISNGDLAQRRSSFRFVFTELPAVKRLLLYTEWKCDAIHLYYKGCVQLLVSDNRAITAWEFSEHDAVGLQQCQSAEFEGYVEVLDVEMLHEHTVHTANDRVDGDYFGRKRIWLQRCVSYEWNIDPVLLQKFKHAAVEKAFYSRNFDSCHQNWCLRCIPCNKDGVCSVQVALLRMPMDIHSVKAEVELMLNGKAVWTSSMKDIVFDRDYQWFCNNDLNAVKTSELYFMDKLRLSVSIKILVVYTYDTRNKGEAIAVPPCDWHKYNITL